MRMEDAAKLALANLRKNPVRTMLTILGLGVGIGAILTVLTLGSAGQYQVEEEIARLGVDKVWVTAEEGSSVPLDAHAGEAIAAATGAPACAGAYTMSAVTLGDCLALAQVSGYDEEIETVHHPYAVEGRLFIHQEYESASPVALVDEAMASSLGGDVIGKRLDVGSRKVRIVGIIGGMKVQAVSMANGMVILPLQTFLDTYAASEVGEVTVGVPRGSRADEIGEMAVAALAHTGGSYKASSLQEEIDAARSVIRIFVMVLACVAAVCMLTGGIGVMNILLVSVRERRREIGLIKAIGGTSGQVGALFLMEAVCYSLLGGLLGIILGVAMIAGFGRWIGLSASLGWETALPALMGAMLLGLAFGVAPALRAAGMIPVDALKQE